jgi:ATP-dependent Zn protease
VNDSALVEGIIAWLPMIIVMAVWYFLMRGSRNNTREIMDMNREILSSSREQLAANLKMSETMTRIEKLLEDRKA